jgi:DnaK suppressor protein
MLCSIDERSFAMIDHANIRAQLEAQRTELAARSGRLEAELAEPLSADWEEQAVQREDDESLDAQASLIDRDIAAIDAALGRIDNGSYGICAVCGEGIAEARLAAMPTTTRCVACATQ